MRFREPFSQLFRAGGIVTDNESGIVHVHRYRAAYDHLAGEIAGLREHIVQTRPMHSEQQRVGAFSLAGAISTVFSAPSRVRVSWIRWPTGVRATLFLS
jgi:hypothetical protein